MQFLNWLIQKICYERTSYLIKCQPVQISFGQFDVKVIFIVNYPNTEIQNLVEQQRQKLR